MVYWLPPEEAGTCLFLKNHLICFYIRLVKAATEQMGLEEVHRYGSVEGTQQLRQQLSKKIEAENGITNKEIMVTAGANQGKSSYSF